MDGVAAYRRQSTVAQQIAMVFLNFSDQQQSVSVPFPEPGLYRERIDGANSITVAAAGQPVAVDVPSNYGCIFVK